MDENYLPEKWANIEFEENISEKETYKISTYGNVKSLKVEPEFGIVIKLFSVGGYKRLPLVQKSGKRTARYIHKLVAQAFLEKTDDSQKFVIHLDYNKENNNTWNLSWATKKEKEEHQFSNPKYKDPSNRVRNSKLNEGRVKLIKRKLNDPNRKTRMKMIARQFGISEMQLYRIKTGENWGYVTVD
ncbi:MAG: HNH endonuclease [Flavobacteriaceae bacterium]|nr:HNH endonuclease [Flavobacteriaceae bacterium]